MLVAGYVRPLSIWQLNDELPANVSHAPGDLALSLLGHMFDTNENSLETARERSKRVSSECDEPPIVPGHPKIMRHVIRPLQEAKHCYVLGMPVACIAQAGLVGEMVALWRFRMLQPRVDSRPLDSELQKLLWGREFDKLGQAERVRVLRAIDDMDEETVQAFGKLRSLRRKYLHFMVDSKNDIDADARQSLQYANTLVQKTLNITFADGKVILPPKLAKYVENIIKCSGPSAAPAGKDET
jgi:hypothetical protein